jgi:hypothetical protein
LFLIITNAEYNMKSIDKLHYTFPASPVHDEWHRLNLEQDTAQGFESFVHGKFGVHQMLQATHSFRCQRNGKKEHNSIIFRYTGDLLRSVISLMTTHQALHIGQSHWESMSGESTLSCCVRIQDTGLQIRSNAGVFVGI